MSSLQIFAQEMQALAQTVGTNIVRLQKGVAMTVVEDVALETPVLTGQAAANWKTQIGAPDQSYDMGPNANAGQQSVDNAKVNLSGLAMGQTVYITNNVPYIVSLNSGYSAKAPAGFVEMAIVDALYKAGNFNLLIK